MRPASSVVGLEMCVEVGHGVSVSFDTFHDFSIGKLTSLLRARESVFLRLVEVGEHRVAYELWVEPQDLHAVRVELCDDFGLGAE